MGVQWPENKAWLAGDITSLEALEITYRREVATQRAIYRACTVRASAEYHRKQMCAAYLRLRALRRK